jgi:dachs protein
MATLGLSKVFILDKYFTELQKFWETEKKLQGRFFKRAARVF